MSKILPKINNKTKTKRLSFSPSHTHRVGTQHTRGVGLLQQKGVGGREDNSLVRLCFHHESINKS